MSRKDYQLIAQVLFLQYHSSLGDAQQAVKDTIIMMADVLQMDNSAFNRGKFLKACGIE